MRTLAGAKFNSIKKQVGFTLHIVWLTSIPTEISNCSYTNALAL